MNLFRKHSDYKLIEINTIVLTILLFLFRTTVPFLKFPFLLFFFGLLLYSLFNYRIHLLSISKEFFRNFYLSIILLLILIVSFLLSNKLYLVIFKDGISAILLMALLFLLTLFIRSRRDINIFIESLIRFIVFITLYISIALLCHFLNIFPNDNIFSRNSLLGSTTSDYNFALLPLFFGMVGVFYLLNESGSPFKKAILNFLQITYSITILLSGSRRGFIIFCSMVIILLFIQFLSLFRRASALTKIVHISKAYIISLIILLSLVISIHFLVPVQIKRHTLIKFGVTVRSFKYFSTDLLDRYCSIITNNRFNYFLNWAWNEKFDPLNPDTGWNSRVSTQVYSLPGENAGIVPKNSIGYKMDKTNDPSKWANNSYSHTDISKFFQGDTIISNDEFYYASVYCYVSEDFDGAYACISTESKASGKTYRLYDLNKKGVWQKLIICFKKSGSIAPVNLVWSKYGVSDFSTLKGYVIFAYPEYKTIRVDPRDPDTGWGSRLSISEFPLTGKNADIVPANSIGYKMDSTTEASNFYNNSYSFTDITSIFNGDTTIEKSRVFHLSVYCFVSEDFNGTDVQISAYIPGNILQGYNSNEKGTWQLLQADFIAKSGIPPVYLFWSKSGVYNFANLKGYVIFACPKYELIRKKASGISLLTTTDTYQYKAGFFASYMPIVTTLFSIGIEKDPIRKWASKFISEDTTYYGYKHDLFVDTISNKLSGDRVMRWHFALQIFSKEYNWKQKTFGGGFNFLNWYGYYFKKNKLLSDYPHNPFLSVLLYSGIFGLIIYLAFMYRVIYYYVKYFRQYKIISIFFIIAFLFSFFSAGSPFDPPIMGFFSLLPFLIHSVHQRPE
jgi:hypothetical protein